MHINKFNYWVSKTFHISSLFISPSWTTSSFALLSIPLFFESQSWTVNPLTPPVVTHASSHLYQSIIFTNSYLSHDFSTSWHRLFIEVLLLKNDWIELDRLKESESPLLCSRSITVTLLSLSFKLFIYFIAITMWSSFSLIAEFHFGFWVLASKCYLLFIEVVLVVQWSLQKSSRLNMGTH